MQRLKPQGFKRSFLQKWQNTFAVLFLAVSLLIPQSAKAQCGLNPPQVFSSTITTLEQAIYEIENNQYVPFNGEPLPASFQALQNDLNSGPGPHMPVDEFVQRVIDALSLGRDHVRNVTYVPGVSDYGDPYIARTRIREALGIDVPPGTAENGPLSFLHFTLTAAFVPDAANTPLTTADGQALPFSSSAFTVADRLINYIISGGGNANLSLRALWIAAGQVPDTMNVFRVLSGGIIPPPVNSGDPLPYPCDQPGAVCQCQPLAPPLASPLACFGGSASIPRCNVVSATLARFKRVFTGSPSWWYHPSNSPTVDIYINNNYQNGEPQFYQTFIANAYNGITTWSNGNPNPNNPVSMMGWTMGWPFGSIDPNTSRDWGIWTYDNCSSSQGCSLDPLARQWAYSIAHGGWMGTPLTVSTPTPDPTTWNEPDEPADADPANSIPPTTPFNPNTTYPDLNNDANYQGDNEYHPYIDDEEILATGNNLPCDGYDPTNDDDHPLENDNSWAKDPCVWTHDNPKLSPAIDFAEENQGDNQPPQNGEGHKAGWLFSNYLAHWWKYEFMPALQDYTKEDSAGKSDGARQQGTITDAENIAKTSKVIQKEELKAKREYQPNEKTCVVGSHTSVATTTETTATALSQGLSSELSAAAGDMSGTYDNPSQDPPTSEGAGGGGGTPGSGPSGGKNVHNQGTYTRSRLGDYCANFQDSDANNGDNICTVGRSDTSKDSDAMPMNGDIDIEGFLMKDTLPITEGSGKETAVALLQNLVYPKVMPEIPDDVLDKTVAGQYTLVKEHIEGVKKIAADVISSMLARRAGITLPEKYIKSVNPGYGLPPDSNTGMPVDVSNYENGTPVPETGDFYAWRAKLMAKEGGGKYTVINGYNYLGVVQMGEETLIGSLEKPRFIKVIKDSSHKDLNQLGLKHLAPGLTCAAVVAASNIYSGANPTPPCQGTLAACARKYSTSPIIPCNGTVEQCKRSYVLCNDSSGNFPSWQTYTKFRSYKSPDHDSTADVFPIGDKRYAIRVFDYEWIAETNYPAGNGFQRCAGVRTNKDYIESEDCQRVAHFMTMKALWRTIKAKGLTAYVGKNVNGVFVGPSGLLLAGWGGWLRLKQWLTNDPKYKPDAYGTTAGSRIILGNGHNLSTPVPEYVVPGMSDGILIPAADVPQNYGAAVEPSIVLSGAIDSPAAQAQVANIPDPVTVNADGDAEYTPLPPGVGTGTLTDVPGPGGTIKQMIRAIREKAGVPPGDISDAPSYNEVMKALTKERFLNPEYYATLAADVGQLKQEQAGVKAYISIQLQDIYKLQEQINALMAARAGMKLNKEQFDDLLEASAVRRNP